MMADEAVRRVSRVSANQRLAKQDEYVSFSYSASRKDFNESPQLIHIFILHHTLREHGLRHSYLHPTQRSERGSELSCYREYYVRITEAAPLSNLLLSVKLLQDSITFLMLWNLAFNVFMKSSYNYTYAFFSRRA
jgi:hypothetical protein